VDFFGVEADFESHKENFLTLSFFSPGKMRQETRGHHYIIWIIWIGNFEGFIFTTQTSCTMFSGKVFKITKHLQCSTTPPKKTHRYFHDFWNIPPRFFKPRKKNLPTNPQLPTNQPTNHSFLASSSKSSGTLGALPRDLSGFHPWNFETSWRGACYFFIPRPQGTNFEEKIPLQQRFCDELTVKGKTIKV